MTEMAPGLLWFIIVAFSFTIYFVLRMAEFAFTKLRRLSRSRIIMYDPDAHELRILWLKLKDGEFVLGKGESARRYKVHGGAAVGASSWIVHPRHGWNLVGLTDAETVDRDALLQRLAIFDPSTYYHLHVHNKPKEALRANDRDDKFAWVFPVALLGLVALLAVLGIVIFIASKMGHSGAAPA